MGENYPQECKVTHDERKWLCNRTYHRLSNQRTTTVEETTTGFVPKRTNEKICAVHLHWYVYLCSYFGCAHVHIVTINWHRVNMSCYNVTVTLYNRVMGSMRRQHVCCDQMMYFIQVYLALALETAIQLALSDNIWEVYCIHFSPTIYIYIILW
jgi:hypothetical protein